MASENFKNKQKRVKVYYVYTESVFNRPKGLEMSRRALFLMQSFQ